MEGIVLKGKKNGLRQETDQKISMGIFFIKRRKNHTKMLKRTTERKRLKAMGRMTTFMNHYSRTGQMVDADPCPNM